MERVELKRLKLLELNAQAERDLFKLMSKPADTHRPGLKHAQLEHMAKLKSDELQAFIHARVSDEVPAPAGMIPSQKGSLNAAREGARCRVLAAFQVRGQRHLKLKAQSAGAGGGAAAGGGVGTSPAAAAAAAAPAVPVALLTLGAAPIAGAGGGNNGPSASDLLCTEEHAAWRNRVGECLVGYAGEALQVGGVGGGGGGHAVREEGRATAAASRPLLPDPNLGTDEGRWGACGSPRQEA